MEKQIDTIFIDLGDTFRVIRKDEAYQMEAKATITRLLGVDAGPAEFYRDVIEPRYDKYREWALTFYCEAPVKELWTRWLAYDFPKEKVEAAAAEMTYAYRRTKGERVVTDGGIETVKELYARGYTLGIVSDLVGTEEVDATSYLAWKHPQAQDDPLHKNYTESRLSRMMHAESGISDFLSYSKRSILLLQEGCRQRWLPQSS